MRRFLSSDFRLRLRLRPRRSLHVGREEGQALVEFAFVFSMLMMLLLGIVTFGIAFYDQILLANAASDAAQVLMAGSGVIPDPCGSANTAFAAAASNLNNANIYGKYPLSFSISAYTNSSTPNTVGPYQVSFSGSNAPSCSSEAADLTQYQQVVVTATYGCNLTIFGYNFAPNCKLTAQTSEAVQ